jgi:hypothetical protein
METMRELAGHQRVPPEPHFRWRGGEITRLEGFTDAVFAFAVTLLVYSLNGVAGFGPGSILGKRERLALARSQAVRRR